MDPEPLLTSEQLAATLREVFEEVRFTPAEQAQRAIALKLAPPEVWRMIAASCWADRTVLRAQRCLDA
jgi:hypothetical protein